MVSTVNPKGDPFVARILDKTNPILSSTNDG
jgi:hypothetical protein